MQLLSQLHLDGEPKSPEKKEVDFFEDQLSTTATAPVTPAYSMPVAEIKVATPNDSPVTQRLQSKFANMTLSVRSHCFGLATLIGSFS